VQINPKTQKWWVTRKSEGESVRRFFIMVRAGRGRHGMHAAPLEARGVLCPALPWSVVMPKSNGMKNNHPPGTSLCAREAVPPRLQIIRANSFAASHSLLTQKKDGKTK